MGNKSTCLRRPSGRRAVLPAPNGSRGRLCGTLRERYRERLAFWRSRNLLGNAKRFLVGGLEAAEILGRMPWRKSPCNSSQCASRCPIHTWYDKTGNQRTQQVPTGGITTNTWDFE